MRAVRHIVLLGGHMMQPLAPDSSNFTPLRLPGHGRTDVVKTLMALVEKLEPESERSVECAEQLMREKERHTERTRILRDMHDGVGSHISTAIRQLQTGNASREEVLHTLRDSLDHLKLSIDAMNQPPGDFNALLANLRYRIEPRFLACGIPWQWQVDLLKPIIRVDANAPRQQMAGAVPHRRVRPRLMDTSAMRQLQFMLLEALSNVLQHSQANMLCIAARPADPQGLGVLLQIIDNGRGFDVSRCKRKGLLSMQDRADAIGATLHLSSAPGRTVVEIAVQ
jgi:signal transduction histidine kinase